MRRMSECREVCWSQIFNIGKSKKPNYLDEEKQIQEPHFKDVAD